MVKEVGGKIGLRSLPKSSYPSGIGGGGSQQEGCGPRSQSGDPRQTDITERESLSYQPEDKWSREAGPSICWHQGLIVHGEHTVCGRGDFRSGTALKWSSKASDSHPGLSSLHPGSLVAKTLPSVQGWALPAALRTAGAHGP